MLNAQYPPVGVLLREWRTARRMSQFGLALECGMSARHIGFVEIGRTRPSRDTLSVSLRERNAMMLAAGFAPNYA